MTFVRDLMVTAANCKRVHQDMTIREAILMLEYCPGACSGGEARKFQAMLVLNDDGFVVGNLSPSKIVMSMDPIDQSQQNPKPIAHTASVGLTPGLLKSLTQDSLSSCETFKDTYQHVLNLKLRDCMRPRHTTPCVFEGATLAEATHKMMLGDHRSLLVESGENIVGGLRISDVFQQLTLERAGLNSQKQTDKIGN